MIPIPTLPDVASLLLDTWVKGAVMLCLAGTACLLLRRASAAYRHMVWSLALAALLLLPLLWMVVPKWQLAVLPSITTASAPEKADAAMRWTDWVVLCWGVGAVAVALPMIGGLAAVRAMLGRAIPVRHRKWLGVLDEARRRLGLRRGVRLVWMEPGRVPLTWGLLRPCVALPREAAAWGAQKRAMVLLHELAHIRRRDWLIKVVTGPVLMLHWINPLVWIACRQMGMERERACDDVVLTDGAAPADYAGHLVGVAMATRAHLAGIAPAILAVQRPTLERRIMGILDGCRARNPVRRVHGAAASVALVLVAGSLATLSLTARDEPVPTDFAGSRAEAVSAAAAGPSGSQSEGAPASGIHRVIRNKVATKAVPAARNGRARQAKLTGKALERHLREYQAYVLQNGMPPLPIGETV
ncbi:M56 family metallopeptidase [Verrucomicrobiota bacterium]